MDRFDRLAQHAADQDIDVEWCFDLPDEYHGFYESGVIWLNYRCTMAQAVSALAHELGHAEFGDTCTSEAIERRADEWGASFAITAEEYAEAEEVVGEHAGALARALGVTRDLILAWRRWWWRAGRFEKAA